MVGTWLRFRMLGAFEARLNGRLLHLGQPKQRALVALLALRRQSVVTVPELVDAIWGDAPPKRPANQIQVYICGLRQAFATHGLPRQTIHTRSGGYLLDCPADSVDTFSFEAGVSRAHRLRTAGQLIEADRTLGEALTLWRGRPLADLAGEVFVRAAAYLEERRLAALEEWTQIRLALGAHQELAADLRATVAGHPLREGLRHALILALYRAGRPAEALAVYREGRQIMVNELGIEPGPALQALQRRILRGEPAPMSAGAGAGRQVGWMQPA